MLQNNTINTMISSKMTSWSSIVFFTYGELTYMHLMYGKTSHANFPVLGSQRPYAYAPDGPGLSKNIVQVHTAELRRALPSAHHSSCTKTQWHLVTTTVQLSATRGYKMHHSGSHPGSPQVNRTPTRALGMGLNLEVHQNAITLPEPSKIDTYTRSESFPSNG